MNQLVDEKFVKAIQSEVIDEGIKPMIASGQSPVESYEGNRRFAGYKDPKAYPGDRKSKRPVSLFLTGEMLSWYKSWAVSGRRISLGIPTNAPHNVKVKAEANNVGTVDSYGQIAIAARRFIPIKGETYRVTIMRKLKNLYARRIKELLSSK